MNENKIGRLERFRSDMTLNIIGVLVFLLTLLAVIIGAISLFSFNSTYLEEHSTATYHMADTATTLINGDNLNDYLEGEKNGEYHRTRQALDAYCKRMNLSLIYVIQVDRSDYGRFVSIFNSVDNTVDNSSYKVWGLGYKRDTTNDEYRQKYKALYDQESAYETVFRRHTTDGQHPHITTIVPVKNSEGDVAALLCVQRPMSELEGVMWPYLVKIAVSTFLLALVVSLLSVSYIRRHFIEPIIKVSDEATRFARENTKGEPLGTLSGFKEISNLSLSIDTMEKDMVDYIENLTTITAERERISAELALASSIQEDSIPNEYPAFPDRKEFDIYASMEPAREISGDFYNFFLVDEDHLAMMIGDVSGKGVPAALFMMVTNIVLSYRTHMGGLPEDILTAVNHALYDHNKQDMFVSVWLGILEISTGKLRAVNAGHEFPVLKKPDGQFELFKDKHGVILAAWDELRYKGYEILLEPGSKLFVYTDGIPEATDAENRMMGLDRMVDALNEDPDASPEGILGNVRKAVDDFVKGAEQFDDLTMLCIEYKGTVE